MMASSPPFAPDQAPTILVGAFDRHNLGDMLFPHIVSAMLPGRRFLLSGLVDRDLRPFGGHRVATLPKLLGNGARGPVNIVHVGGEILTCDVWEAALMVLGRKEAHRALSRYGDDRSAGRIWAQKVLGIRGLAPYMLSADSFDPLSVCVYNSVGGVELDSSAPELRGEVLEKLRTAAYVAVRERVTLAQLRHGGIDATLSPDPVVMLKELFREKVFHEQTKGEAAEVRRVFHRGYVAVQFGADFGDDATLRTIAAGLDTVVSQTGLPVVFFRAGAALWHDDLDCFRRVAGFMRSDGVWVFQSLNIWQVSALIAGSRVYCGSSLHGRIVALSFAVRRLSIRIAGQPAAGAESKQSAFIRTWEDGVAPGVVPVDEIAEGVGAALDAHIGTLDEMAHRLRHQYKRSVAAWSGLLH